jgi:hypothetical protein
MKQDVWIIADSFVVEAYLGGMMLGEKKNLDMSVYNIVAEYTQEELDAMFEEFHDEHGHYPYQ